MIADIMKASESDSKTFHKLIRIQRSNTVVGTDTLTIDDNKYSGEQLMDAWKIHFETLATPVMKECFDSERLTLSRLQNKMIGNDEKQKTPIPQTTRTEII